MLKANNRRIRCYGNNTKSVMLLLILLSLSLLLVRESLCKVNQAVPTYFGRKDENGKLIDATDKKIWQKVNVKNVYVNQTVVIEVKPSIVKDGHYVSVSWKGVTNPKETDFVAFYCPEHAKDSDYVDYFSVRESPTTTYEDGVGHHSVRLTNLRTNCEFRYFRSISKDLLERAAVSNIVMFEGGPDMPLQIHLALTGNPTEMRVMWVSATDETPVVTYGANPKNLKSIAKGKSQTYTASDLCSIQGLFINPGYIHDVLLTGLKPYSVYYYSCGVPGHMSAIRSFKTALPGGSDVCFKFLAYGDMGISAAARRTAKYILADVEKNNYEFILHNGDISYALGVSYIWDQWHSLIQPYSSIVPYMVGIGNHEQNHIDNSSKDPSGVKGDGFHPWWGTFDDDSHGECGVPMFYRFHMPDNGNYVWWYSFDYGLVHFVMISTEHDLSNGTRQYAWLENDLKNVNRSITPWIILGGHRPMYCSQVEPDEFTVALAFQAMFENLLYEYKVDLALWAHYHSYERTCAMYQNKCVKGGTVHIVIGTAGREADWPPFWSQNWSKFQRHVDPYGYGRVKVVNRTALLWEYFVNKEEEIADYVWLIKEDKLD